MEIQDDRANVIKMINTIIPGNNDDVIQLKYMSITQMIANLKLVNGKYLFTNDNLTDIYDLYFMFKNFQDSSLVVSYLTDIVIPMKNEMILKQEPELYSISVFESPLLKLQKDNEEKVIALQDYKGDLSSNSICGRCGSTENYLKIKQTRSVDEGPTSIYTCPKCNNCWCIG